jgi:hypothetical protein
LKWISWYENHGKLLLFLLLLNLYYV